MSRVYVGNLDPQVTSDELQREMNRFGTTSSIWVARSPPGFAFVEFEDARDAEDAVRELSDVRIGAQRIKCEIAKNRGRNSAPAGGAPPPRARGGGGGGGGPAPFSQSGGTKHRAVLKNLPASFSWKELKDEMRRIGDVIYADVDFRGDGVVEFATAEDLDYAVRRLDGSKLDGNTISVFKENRDDDRRAPPPDDRYDRRDDRRDQGGRGDDYGRRDDRREDDRRDRGRREDDFDRRPREDDYDRRPREEDRRYRDDDRGRGRDDREEDRRFGRGDDRGRGREDRD